MSMSAVLNDEDERTPRTCNRRRKRIAVLATILSIALLPTASAVMTSYEISSSDDGVAAQADAQGRAVAGVDAAGEAAFPLPLTGGVGQPGGADGDSSTDVGADGTQLRIAQDGVVQHVETRLIGARGPEVRSSETDGPSQTQQTWLVAALIGLGAAAVASLRRARRGA